MSPTWPEEIGNAQGGYYDVCGLVANDGTKWIGVPWNTLGVLVTYRKSWFAEIGYERRQISADLGRVSRGRQKAQGCGTAVRSGSLGHTWGDPPSFWYPYLWSWGSKEVEHTTARR